MIKVVLRGGLGNQMFQCAAGLNLASKNKTELVLDTTILNDRLPRKELMFRTYGLDVFKIKPKFTKLSWVSKNFPIPGIWSACDLFIMKLFDILQVNRLIKEKNSKLFDPSVLGVKKDATLFGFWQSEEYFEDSNRAVREAFQFKFPLEGEARLIAEKIEATNSVSLHVRRGDYVKFKSMADMMGGTDIAYYNRAVHYISERVSDPHFFVFSDDIEWCKENLKLIFPVTYVSAGASGPKAIFHLELMSLCKHNIIANSTFSWWGAWLNNNPEKIVVAPKKWYASESSGANDIIPTDWTVL